MAVVQSKRLCAHGRESNKGGGQSPKLKPLVQGALSASKAIRVAGEGFAYEAAAVTEPGHCSSHDAQMTARGS